PERSPADTRQLARRSGPWRRLGRVRRVRGEGGHGGRAAALHVATRPSLLRVRPGLVLLALLAGGAVPAAAQAPTLTITLQSETPRIQTTQLLADGKFTALNDTDLEELTRWLKGDVSPAVSGRGSVGSALTRGAQRIIVRIAGLPRLTLESRSEVVTREN